MDALAEDRRADSSATKLAVLVNAKGGTAQSLEKGSLREDLEKAFAGADIRFTHGDDVPEAVQEVFSDDAIEEVIVAGGDGTVSLAAKASVESGKPFGVIPLGTMNLFARTMRLPLEPADAIEALRRRKVREIDVGEVNGETFVNHVSLGFHPQLIRMRDAIPRTNRAQRMWNGVRVWWRLMSRHTRHKLTVSGDFDPFGAKAGLAAVSVNPIMEGVAQIPHPDGQRAGVLGIYVSTHATAWELNKVLYRMAAGTLSDSEHIEIRHSPECVIRGSRSFHMSIDGEVFVAKSPIRCRVRRRGLKVLVPVDPLPEDD